jgi:hypothetical protein
MRTNDLLCAGCALVLIGLLGVLPVTAVETGGQTATSDPALETMIGRISESGIGQTVIDLQNIPTRAYPSEGNREAAEYLYDRLSSIPGLATSYQGGDLRNVVATLPGTGAASGEVIVVGAHYDTSTSDPGDAPGATDNGAGVAIVLELARVMSEHRFDRTVTFAFWNGEEEGMLGSAAFVADAAADGTTIPLYFNYDSAAYDPDGSNVLDIMVTAKSAEFADRMAELNRQYGIGLELTLNEFACASDHRSFQAGGYPAIMTHSPEHADEAHSGDDTVDLVSTEFAKRNAQLGMLLIASVAIGAGEPAGQPSDQPDATPSPEGGVTTPGPGTAGGASLTASPVTAPVGSAVKFTVTPASGETIASGWWSFDATAHLSTWNSRSINPTFFYPRTGTFAPLVVLTYADGSIETVRLVGGVTAT